MISAHGIAARPVRGVESAERRGTARVSGGGFVPDQSEHSGRLRLTLAITELDPGGAEKAFVRIALGLSQRNWTVHVVSLRDRGALAETLAAAGISVTALNCGGAMDLRAITRLSRLLQQQRPDALLTFLHQANLVGRLAGQWAGIPLIVSGVRVADRRTAVSWPERLTKRYVDHYVAVSAAVAATHGELCRIPSETMSVIRNGVDVAAIRQAPPVSRESLGLRQEDQVVLFVGRLTQQKAPGNLLAAFGALPTEIRNRARLVFVGEGPLKQSLAAEIRAAGLEDRVSLSGWRPDVAGIMKSCDVLVLPSLWEGQPNVVAEALAAGLRVIASDVDGVRELLGNSPRNALVIPGDVPSLTTRLAAFLQRPAGELQAEALPELPSWEATTHQYDQLLRRCLAEKLREGGTPNFPKPG